MHKLLVSILLVIGIFPIQTVACDSNGAQILHIHHENVKNTRLKIIKERQIHKVGGYFSCDSWEKEKNNWMDLDVFAGVELRKEMIHGGIILHYSFLELPPYIIVPSLVSTDQEGWFGGLSLVGLNTFGLALRTELAYRNNIYPEWATAKEFFFSLRSVETTYIPLEYDVYLSKNHSYNSLKQFEDQSWLLQAQFWYPMIATLETKFGYGFHYLPHSEAELSWFSTEKADLWKSILLGLRYTKLDKKMNPRDGIWLEMEWQPNLLWGSEKKFHTWRLDARYWMPIGKHTLHMHNLLRLRNGEIPFYEEYHLGGVNTLRGFSPSHDRKGHSEVLYNLEYRHQLIPTRSMQIWPFPWYIHRGLEAVIGLDHIWLWDDEKQIYNSPYIGIHILLPAIQRLRIEVGLRGISLDWQLNVGMFEKAQSQNWKTR
jgi:outer membrane protein assembly factor BamA